MRHTDYRLLVCLSTSSEKDCPSCYKKLCYDPCGLQANPPLSFQAINDCTAVAVYLYPFSCSKRDDLQSAGVFSDSCWAARESEYCHKLSSSTQKPFLASSPRRCHPNGLFSNTAERVTSQLGSLTLCFVQGRALEVQPFTKQQDRRVCCRDQTDEAMIALCGHW